MAAADPADARALARAILGGKTTPTRKEVRQVKKGLMDAARQGDVEAQTLLGAIELEVDGNPRAARPWFERAAAQGDPAAQRSLGYLYATGQGVTADEAKAVELYKMAAAAGDPYAMYNLALVNIGADGRYLELSQVVLLLRGAEEAGIADAAARLGDVLAGVDRDGEAVEAYTRAAERGHTGAMYALGCWARDGVVGPPDRVEAVRWYLSMFTAGNGNGIHHAVQLAGQMNDEQIAEAARRAGRPDLAQALTRTARPG